MSARPRLLGIDPGSRVTGWGVLERGVHGLVRVASGTVRLDTDATLSARLVRIHEAVGELLEAHGPVAVGLEEAFVGMNVRSAIKLAEARAACLLAIEQAGLPVHEVPPALVKKAVTGHGRASKETVRRAVMTALGLDEAPAYDAADALAIALCVARRLDAPQALVGVKIGRRRGRRRRWTAEDIERLEQQRRERS